MHVRMNCMYVYLTCEISQTRIACICVTGPKFDKNQTLQGVKSTDFIDLTTFNTVGKLL